MQTKVFTVLIAMAMATGLATMLLNKGQSPIPTHVEATFNAWTVQHNKNYSSPAEKLFRLGVFYTNVLKIAVINAEGSHSAQVNHFADMTAPEFSTKMLGYRFSSKHITESKPFTAVKANPTSVDWRKTAGVVSPVKNQEQCGSCWAFSAIESLESARVLIAKETLVTLSPQQLVDCSHSYGNDGCEGGLMDNAFKYIAATGIESDASYPYTGKDDKCVASGKSVLPTLTKYEDVPVKNWEALETAVAAQPVSIAVDAQSWQFYHKGILSRNFGTQLDHGVVVLGYGVEGNKKFWIVRNSWTAQWGESGYIRILKKEKNNAGVCGILLAASRVTAF